MIVLIENTAMPHAKPRPLFAQTPADASLTPVTTGIAWLRLPLPFALNHVNVWLLDNGSNLDVIDAGFPLPVNKDAWQAALGTRTISNIFLTHCHPDHIGLAGWLSEQFPHATCHITQREEHLARLLCDDTAFAALLPRHAVAYQAMGLDDDSIATMFKRMGGYKMAVAPLPPAFSTIAQGDTIRLGQRDWTVIEGFGHSPEHASLYCAQDDIFIAGDMVLPYISPNISLTPRDSDDANPLAAYLDSLDRIKRHVPDSALVLPSHGVPFYGLHDRIDTIIAHHHARCDDITTMLEATPLLPVQVMEKLFSGRTFEANTLFFALGETMAHLRYMERTGRIQSQTESGKILFYKA